MANIRRVKYAVFWTMMSLVECPKETYWRYVEVRNSYLKINYGGDYEQA
jgi:hypothetical protein